MSKFKTYLMVNLLTIVPPFYPCYNCDKENEIYPCLFNTPHGLQMCSLIVDLLQNKIKNKFNKEYLE